MNRFVRSILVVAALPLIASCVTLVGFDTDRPLRDETGAESGDGATPAAREDGGGDGGDDAGPSVDRSWASWGISGSSFPSDYAEYGVDVTDAIFDVETTLGWPLAPALDPVTWSDAPRVCMELRAGGFSDWRLPTRIELLSIVQYSQYPAADPRFEIPVDAYWTASSYADDPTKAWAIDFTFGTATGKPKDEAHHVRCVRGGKKSANGPAQRFSTGVGVVFDKLTNLTWQADTVPVRTFLEAREYCSRVLINGKDGFRVPLAHELHTLVDDHRAAPALYPLFAVSGGATVWSMTNASDGASTIVTVDFAEGRTILADQAKLVSVLCVQ